MPEYLSAITLIAQKHVKNQLYNFVDLLCSTNNNLHG